MQPLIDCDILRYEVGFAAERPDEDIWSFDSVKELFDTRIREICNATDGTDPILYISQGRCFRDDIAVTKPYKGNRAKSKKPFHYANLTAYIKSLPGCQVIEWIEADDAMCIEQTSRLEQKDTVICSRDKDLKQCEGYHYGWECGKQPEWKMRWVNLWGDIELSKDRKSIKGTGTLFFLSQVLTGDSTDNIPGCPKIGPVKAYEILMKYVEYAPLIKSDPFVLVAETYAEFASAELLEEQLILLYLLRSKDEIPPRPKRDRLE
jgi:hypothetical protein|tara:strand:- start:2614 stop:3402 length:789 start_codon:yes stop_codon:yes gene_type:complete